MSCLNFRGTIKNTAFQYHFCVTEHIFYLGKMYGRVTGAFAFLLLNVVAAYRQAPQLEEEVFVAGQGESVNREERLRIITLEPGKVEGEYRATGDDDNGVYFLSEVRKDSRFLLITTLQGEQLYRAVSPRNKDILISLMGNDFLIKNYETIEGRTALQGYLVPAESVAEIEMNLDEPDGIDERLFSAYDDADSLSVMRRSYAKLHRRVERAHFVHASEKLGRDIGVLGSEYPAAMSLYVLAMRLARDEGVARDAIPSRAQSISKAQQSCPAQQLYCSNSKACCGKCPIGNECLGLCGPNCTCWAWVCGHCCYQQGCYDHDICCKVYQSWKCLIVWKFKCDSFNCD